MFGIGPMELLLILAVALLVLGPKRMPELARMLGRGLGEFRRAGHDLRQSLALDDLQNDLRKGLNDAGKIQKPGQKPGQSPDRPAQAGDDLAPGTTAKTTPDTTPDTASDTAIPSDTASPPDAKRMHPGELPADADPHVHNDPEEVDPEEIPAAPKHASPADSPLGNVPVGGATRAGASRPRAADDERG